MDYEKILESLKICSEVGTSCEGCSGRGERHCIANLTKAAAIAIETLLHELGTARRERDVVTKRMIELEQEPVTNRNGLTEPLTLDELRQMDGEPVWCEIYIKGQSPFYGIVHGKNVTGFIPGDDKPANLAITNVGAYGFAWLAYRQKPEEGTV